ncbi:MAG: PspC domain [Eubacteriales bacterium]|nr:PspC domain [Eubacteriales bacterium]
MSGGVRFSLPPRSRKKVIAGVAGGLAEYLGIDPLWVQAAFVIFALMTKVFPAMIVYFLLAVLMPPPEEAYVFSSGEGRESEEMSSSRATAQFWSQLVLLVGILFIATGLWLLALNFLPYEIIERVRWFFQHIAGPVALIVLGLFLILYRGRSKKEGGDR